MKPREGMKLRFRSLNGHLDKQIVTAHRDSNGLWYVVWTSGWPKGRISVPGASGLTDNAIKNMWEVIDMPEPEHINAPTNQNYKGSCQHTETKSVPLGIGGDCTVITVCCNCGEEV